MRLRLHRAPLLLVPWSGTGWLLLRLDGRALGVPFGSTTALSVWLERTDPAVMAAAILRLVALALWGYLTAVTALLLLASVLRWRPATVSASRLAPSLLQRMLLGTAGVGLTSTVVSSAASPVVAVSAPADSDTDRTAIMVQLEPAGPGTTAATPSTTSTTTVPSTTSTTPSVPSATTPDPRDTDSDAKGAADKGTDATDTSSDTWMVQTGDSFWSIAEEIVAEQLASQGASSPTEADIARYWQVLIRANRDRLADRANPDLLFPGQELVLPRSQRGTHTAK